MDSKVALEGKQVELADTDKCTNVYTQAHVCNKQRKVADPTQPEGLPLSSSLFQPLNPNSLFLKGVQA